MGPYDNAPQLPASGILHPRELVSGERFELEIGPGRGWFMFERLQAMPQVALIGLEIRRKWASIVDERLGRSGLAGRARVFAEDARTALPRFATGSLSVVYVHFPDPWWKKRHRKRLVVTAPVLAEVVRLLEPGGEFFLQTDVLERAKAYAELLQAEPRLEAWGGQASVPDNPYDARSPRERRALSDGLPVQRLRYRRI